MTDKQKIFCNEYLIDMNATRAYKVAYPNCKKDKTARANSSRLIAKANIQAYITERMEDREERTQITQDMVINELAKIAFFNIKDIFNENGDLKAIKEIDDKSAGAISSVKILQKAGAMKLEIGGDIPLQHIPEQTVEIKLNDKKGALELLGKHLGMFKETNMNVNMNYEEYLKRVDGDEY